MKHRNYVINCDVIWYLLPLCPVRLVAFVFTTCKENKVGPVHAVKTNWRCSSLASVIWSLVEGESAASLSASLPRNKNSHYVLYTVLIWKEFRGQGCCGKWVLELLSVKKCADVECTYENNCLRFCNLVGPDINLLKYNFAVTLQISHRRILKVFLFGRVFKIFITPSNIANAVQYYRILYFYTHIYVHTNLNLSYKWIEVFVGYTEVKTYFP